MKRKENNEKTFLTKSYKGKKPWKQTKGTFCKNCKKTGHIEPNC